MFRRKARALATTLPLPGRKVPVQRGGTHRVLSTPLHPPFPDGHEQAFLALGPFWQAEQVFWQIPGVYATAVGYCGGATANPTYHEVRSGRTGHAETVLIDFDPSALSYRELLDAFWDGHDPTRQVPPHGALGAPHRSAIFWITHSQREVALASRDSLQQRFSASGRGPIATEIAESGPFYYAESSHQQRLARATGPGV